MLLATEPEIQGRRTMRGILLLLICALLIPPFDGYGRKPPRPAQSEYLTTEGAGFIFGNGEAKYAMTHSVRKPFATPVFATVVFENPLDRGSRLRTDVDISPGQKEILARSPGMPKVRNNR